MKRKSEEALFKESIKAAHKKIRVLGTKALRQNLDMFCGGDAAEAYRLGVEEAQGEIVQRLQAIRPGEKP